MCRLKYNILYSGKLSREKLSRISRFCGYLRKFSLQNLGVWHLWCCKSEQSAKVFSAKIIFFANLRKFSPSKVSCYMVSFICAGMIHGLNPLCLEVIEITRKNWIWIFVGSTNTAGLHCRNLPHKLYYKNRVPMQRMSHIILKGVTCFLSRECMLVMLVTFFHSTGYLHPPWSLVAKQKIATIHVQQMSGLQSTSVFYSIQSYPMFICLFDFMLKCSFNSASLFCYIASEWLLVYRLFGLQNQQCTMGFLKIQNRMLTKS